MMEQALQQPLEWQQWCWAAFMVFIIIGAMLVFLKCFIPPKRTKGG